MSDGTATGKAAAPSWAFLSDDVAIVSRLRPNEEGNARYAQQLAAGLASARTVALVGLRRYGGGGQVDLDEDSWPYCLGLLRRIPRRYELLFMWHSAYFTSGRMPDRLLRVLALTLLGRTRRCVYLLHEPDETRTASSLPARVAYALEHRARRQMWRSAAELLFHTNRERDDFLTRYGQGVARATRLVVHGEVFESAIEDATSQDAARLELHLSTEGPLFVCIGFLSAHKGFDRAIKAFEQAKLPSDARLLIVGAPMRDDAATRECVDTLLALSEAAVGVAVQVGAVSDRTFDLTIRAADALIAPYKSVASSSVVPRAQLVGTPVIASQESGLVDQLTTEDRTFASLEQLAEVLAEVAAASAQRGQPPAAVGRPDPCSGQ